MANGPKRKTAWTDHLFNFSLGSSSSTDQELMTELIDPEKRGCTLIRTIIDLWFAPSGPGAAYGFMASDVGIGLVSPDARVGDAMPDPAASGDYPVSGWVWRSRVVVQGYAGSEEAAVPTRVTLDLKSSRKLDRSDPVFIQDNQTAIGTGFVTQTMGIIRLLYKLP